MLCNGFLEMERQDKAGALLEDLAASAAKDAQRLRNEADEELSRCEELSAETAQGLIRLLVAAIGEEQ